MAPSSIKIFLAASSELAVDQRAFEVVIRRENETLVKKNIFLELVIWNEFLESLSIRPFHQVFKEEVTQCDIFIMLIDQRVEEYIIEKFQNAFGLFKSQKPFIFTFFKNPLPTIEDGHAPFKQKLSELGHFYANFNDMNDLWSKFMIEVERLADKGFTLNIESKDNTIGNIGNTIGNIDIQPAEKIYDFEGIEDAKSFKGGRQEKDEKTETQTDEVNCTLYAPREVNTGDQFLVQVFAHTDEQSDLIEKLAHLADDTSTNRGTSRLPEALERNTKIDFNLILPGLSVDEPTLSVHWKGKIVFVQFGVEVPDDFPASDIVGNVIIAKDSVPVGKIKFKLKILSSKSNLVSPDTKSDSNKMIRFKQAFISYASQDRQEVLRRVQMLNLVDLKFFQDLLTLEPGQIWANKIYEYIDSCDVFFLFWSKAASQSEWVLKEVEYARNKKALNWDSPPEIIPVIIEGPPPAKPPDQLKFLHFNDKFIYFINSR